MKAPMIVLAIVAACGGGAATQGKPGSRGLHADEHLTAADVVIGSGLRYGMMFKLIPERTEFQDYVARIVARPASQRAQEKDKELSAQAA